LNDLDFKERDFLVNLNKSKREDDWIKIDNVLLERHRNENKKLMIKAQENKRKFRESLSKQIEEKNMVLNKEKEYEDKCLNKHQEVLMNYDLKEKLKNQLTKDKIKKEREIRDGMVQTSLKIKDIAKKEELNFDKKILSLIKNDIIADQNKLLKKREEEKLIYRKLIEENESNKKIKKENFDKEKLDSHRANINNMKEMERKEIERKLENNQRLEKIQSFMDKFGETVKVDEKKLNYLQELKFLKQVSEKENREKENEKAEMNKKKHLLKEMKITLDQQVQDKKDFSRSLRDFDISYGKNVLIDVGKFNKEKEEKFKNQREGVLTFKKNLEVQLNEKEKNKQKVMDDREKQFKQRNS